MGEVGEADPTVEHADAADDSRRAGPDDGRYGSAARSDPHALQILTTEHWSLLSARSLAYNEAFTRGGMFLAFLSTSFVGLALVSSATGVGRTFLAVTTLVLAFDLVLGLTTYGRIIRANYEDFLAIHGMARIRHVYAEVSPDIAPVFTSGLHDDQAGVLVAYGNPPVGGIGALIYGITSSGGMIALIVAMIAGVLVLAVALLAGVGIELAFLLGAVTAVAVVVGLTRLTIRFWARRAAELETLFPTPASSPRRPLVG